MTRRYLVVLQLAAILRSTSADPIGAENEAVEQVAQARQLLRQHQGGTAERDVRKARQWVASQAAELNLLPKGQRAETVDVDDALVETVLAAFEGRKAVGVEQAAALRRLTGRRKLIKVANVLQSWCFMQRLSADTAEAERAAQEKRRAVPKSPVKRVSKKLAAKRFAAIRTQQERARLSG